MDFETKSRVYVRTDDMGVITGIEGEYSLANCMVTVETGEVDEWGQPITEQRIADGWVLIDEGYGDRFNHAQSQYLDGGLMTEDGVWRWKLVDGKAVERSEAEIAADRAARPEAEPSAAEQLRADVDFLAAMTGVEL